MSDNNLLNKEKFTIQIGDSSIQQEIKCLETNIMPYCGVKKYDFVGDREITFNVSDQYGEFVENMRKELDKMALNAVDVMCHTLKPKKRLPRKLKKAYKNGKKWALNKLNGMWPIFSLKNCAISCDIADGKDCSSDVIYDLKCNKVISIKM